MMASEWNPVWPAGTMRRAGGIGKAAFLRSFPPPWARYAAFSFFAGANRV
jgi:hypothetical protein